MKSETTTTKGNKQHVKVVTITHTLSKKELATQSEPIPKTMADTKRRLVERLSSEIISGKLAEFSLYDNASEDALRIVVTAYVIPPEKMKESRPAPTPRIWTPK
jgi:hypothetical protein